MADVSIVLRARDIASPSAKRLRLEIERLAKSSGSASVSFERLGSTSGRLRSQFTALRGLVAGVGAAFIAREWIQAINTMQNLENRLRLVTDSTQELAAAQNTVIDIARRTRTDLAATGTIYGRIALASQELGLSAGRTARLVETVNKAVAISGSTTAEATGGLIQFSQALASNRLSGEELRSVLENIPALGQLIADGLGVGRGELRRLGEAGELTADQVIAALERMEGRADDLFGQIAPTIAQEFTLLVNELTLLFGRDSSLGIAISGTLQLLTDFLRLINQIEATGELGSLRRNLAADQAELAALERTRDEAESLGVELTGGLSEAQEQRLLALPGIIATTTKRIEELTNARDKAAEAADRESKANQQAASDAKLVAQRAIEAQANLNRILFDGPDFASPDSIADISRVIINNREQQERELRDLITRLNARGGDVVPDDFGGQGSTIGEKLFGERYDVQLEEELNKIRGNLTEFQLELANIFENADTTGLNQLSDGFLGLADSIQESVNASLKAGDSFSEFARRVGGTIAQSLAAALAEFATISAIAFGISTFFGPQAGGAFLTAYYNRQGGFGGGLANSFSGGGGLSGQAAGNLADRAHNGGLITSGGVRRLAGLRSDEVPIIAQTGERVIPRGGSAGGTTVVVEQRERRNRFQQDIEVERQRAANGEQEVIRIVANSMQSGAVGNAARQRFGLQDRLSGRA